MSAGVIIIDKPAGWTSMDVCARLRRVYGERRIGHGGTLDPMATGVLPVFIGRATRAVEFAEKSDKIYLAGLRLGLTTDTQDTSGAVLAQHPVRVSRAELEAVLSRFRGDILQVPPMYSAIKIQGKKLCDLARKGREVERPARPVTVRELTLLEEAAPEGDYLLRIHCSKGTYVRTLCHDIGQALGCGGAMSSLRRVFAAGFPLASAHPLEEVLAAEDPEALLLPVDSLFRDRKKLTLPPAGEKRVRNGMTVVLPGLGDGEYRVYGRDGAFLALCRGESGKLVTIKSFFPVPSQVGGGDGNEV